MRDFANLLAKEPKILYFQDFLFPSSVPPRHQPCSCPSAASTRSSSCLEFSGPWRACQATCSPSPGTCRAPVPARPWGTSWVADGESKGDFQFSSDSSQAPSGSWYSCCSVSSAWGSSRDRREPIFPIVIHVLIQYRLIRRGNYCTRLPQKLERFEIKTKRHLMLNGKAIFPCRRLEKLIYSLIWFPNQDNTTGANVL